MSRSEGNCAGSAHSDLVRVLGGVLGGVSRSEGSCAGSAHSEVVRVHAFAVVVVVVTPST